MFSEMAASNKIGRWSRPTPLTPFVYVLRDKTRKIVLKLIFLSNVENLIVTWLSFRSLMALERRSPSCARARYRVVHVVMSCFFYILRALVQIDEHKVFLLKFESLFIHFDTFRLTGRIKWQHTHTHWYVSGRLQFHRWQLNFNFRVAKMSSSSGGTMDSIIDSTIFNLIRLDRMRVAGPIE